MKIYLLHNLTTNRRYVGICKGPLAKVRHNLAADAKRYATGKLPGRGDGSMIGDVAHYGIDQVTIVMLEETPAATARARRNYWISYYGTMWPNGYNTHLHEVTP